MAAKFTARTILCKILAAVQVVVEWHLRLVSHLLPSVLRWALILVFRNRVETKGNRQVEVS